MTSISYMWRYCIISLLIFSGCSRVVAQDVIFTAQAAANKIGLQNSMEIVFTIQNINGTMSPPANLTKEFNVLQGPFQGRSSNITWVNGKTIQSQTINITYVVQPKHIGNITLAPATAKDADGHNYQSNSLNIQVVQGSVVSPQQQQQRGYDPFGDEDPFEAMLRQRQQAIRQMQQRMYDQPKQQQLQQPPANVNLDKDLFIRVTVDKNKVHLGDQITASYKLYARIPMNCQISKLPSLNGFWTQDFEIQKGPIKPTEEVIDGKKYQVFVLKKSALFPQQTGTLELDPAEAEGVARVLVQSRQQDPFGSMFDDPALQRAFGSLMMNDPLFNNGFFNSMAYQDVKVKLKSIPVKITVTPLPENGKPDDFGGAVGNFTVTSNIDKTNLSTDDVANLKLTISGSGNLKLIEAPKLNLPNGLSYLDPAIIDTITGRTTTISGSKIITYPITPNTAGEYTIPAMPFTFFNPQTGQYVTLNTQPFKINVKQGKGNSSANSRNTQLAKTELQPINTAPLPELIYETKPLIYSAGYWSLYALPLTAFLGLIVWRRREDELSKDIVGLKNKRANKVALKRLATAQKMLAENNRKVFYDEISKAIWLYLSDKLNIPLSELSHEKANYALTSRNVPELLQHKTQRVINECETALYAGYAGTEQMNQTYTEAIDIISKLEDCFKS
ncbi:MAG: protein BatD [Bacteroidetes bacterium]|nr:protein BatD [Bacteroidota bacterium]